MKGLKITDRGSKTASEEDRNEDGSKSDIMDLAEHALSKGRRSIEL